jgi:DNA-binding NarL/FixJ family response regulator
MNMQSDPVRVLLIDDDEDDYTVVRDLLSHISAIECIRKRVSGYGARLDAILSCEFDVCMLDCRLKERNGLELMQEAVSRGVMTPIVFLTGQGDIPRLRELIEKIIPEKSSFDDFEVEHDFPNIGHRGMVLNARMMNQQSGKPSLILPAVEDITYRGHHGR